MKIKVTLDVSSDKPFVYESTLEDEIIDKFKLENTRDVVAKLINILADKSVLNYKDVADLLETIGWDEDDCQLEFI